MECGKTGLARDSPLLNGHLTPQPYPTRDSSGDLDLRLGFDLCDGEREFLDKRKQIVSKALQQVLGLSQAPDSGQVGNGGDPSTTRTKSSLPLRGLCG